MSRSFLILVLALLSPSISRAQFSVDEESSTSQIKILGKKFNPGFYSFASFESDKAQESGGRLSTYNYFSFHSFIANDLRFSIRLPFTYGSAGTDRFNGERHNPQQLEMQDVILEVRNTNLLFLPWDLELYWAGRLYLPNSRTSKQSGQITRFRNHFILSRTFSRYFEMAAEQRFSYFVQSRTAYPVTFRDEEDNEVNTTALTKKMEYEHWLTAWGKITPKTGVGFGTILKDTYYHKSEANSRSKPGERIVSIGPQAKFPIGDCCSFIFSYQDEVNRDNNMNELGRFYSKNSKAMLHSWVNF